MCGVSACPRKKIQVSKVVPRYKQVVQDTREWFSEEEKYNVCIFLLFLFSSMWLKIVSFLSHQNALQPSYIRPNVS